MRRRPIGQILVEKNEISEDDLKEALAEQERTGRRLGEILIEQGRTSWLGLARAIAEQVLDIQASPADPTPEENAEARPDPVELVRQMAEKVANLPPVPDPLPPPQLAPQPQPQLQPLAVAPAVDPEHEFARIVAEQVANLDSPPEPQTTQLLHLTPSHRIDDEAQTKLQNVEAMLRERQRAFIELVTTAETLRSKVAWLEDQLEERNRELARLRLRAS